jgi:SET domain-containing protein
MSINLPFIVGNSPGLNIRGIIASQVIKKNQVIERCPIIMVSKKEEAALKQTVLWKYYYEWNQKYHCICLGYGSLINHSYTPNARYAFNTKTKELIFKALKQIKPGEEITVNYNYIPDSTDPVNSELVDFNAHFD